MCAEVITIPEETKECPTCGGTIPAGATECPDCGEKLTEAEPAEATAEETKETVVSEEGAAEELPEEAPAFGGKMLFILGLLFVLGGFIGGPVMSALHDALQIPILGTNYASFGWLNMTVAIIGVVVGVIGIVLIAISLGKGAPSEEEAETTSKETVEAITEESTEEKMEE